MPFLRFTRDRRGYETTALMHAFREGGRAQPRILYWFRGPIAAKVGRPAIDEEAIRLIEERHPDLSFDWPRILESRATPQHEPEGPPLRRRRPPERGRRGDEGGPRRGEPAVEVEQRPTEPARAEQDTAARRSRRRGRQRRETAAVTDAETPAARAVTAEPHRSAAAEEAFSPEDLTRLRARHAAVLARIDRSVPDAASAAGLRQAADALNPDAWVTSEDVEQALERYETTYRALLDALAAALKTDE